MNPATFLPGYSSIRSPNSLYHDSFTQTPQQPLFMITFKPSGRDLILSFSHLVYLEGKLNWDGEGEGSKTKALGF